MLQTTTTTTTTTTTSRLWFLRHCDKPSDPDNSCCSPAGYDRARAWSTYFMQKWGNAYWEGDLMHPHHVSLYASAFHSKQVCLGVPKHRVGEDGKGSKKCQHSQRMFLTAKAIQHGLESGKHSWDVANQYLTIDTPVHHKYCVGQWKKLLKQILHHLQHQNVTDAIVVWEHSEILDMISHLATDAFHKEGIREKDIEARYADIYNLVLYYDRIQETFGYECFGEPRVACEQVGSLLLLGREPPFLSGLLEDSSLLEAYVAAFLLTVCFAVYVVVCFFMPERERSRWREQRGYISI